MTAALDIAPRFPLARATGILQSDRHAWLAARRLGLGGSEVAAVLGVHPYKSALSVYADKVGAMPPEKDIPEVALWGSIFEGPIRKEYERRSGRVVLESNELLARHDRPWHLCTLDAIQYAPEFGDAPGTGEIKTTGNLQENWAEAVPAYVQIQVQHGLMVTGASWATLVWLPFPERRLQWRDISPHPEFQALLAERVDAFWTRVLNRQPPDADGSESSRLALFHLEPELVDEVVALDAGAEAVADELEQIQRALALLEERKKFISQRVLQTLGPYKVGLLPDERYWTSWRAEPRQEKCASCGAVHTEVAGFRACRLLQPRKKPHGLPRERRTLSLDTDRELARLLEASIRESRNDP